MPATDQLASGDCRHPTYPEYRDEFGEDPARFLYHSDPRPRIRGVQDRELVREYLDVETDRSEPRRSVVAVLNQRLDTLDEQRVAVDEGDQP